MHIDRPVGYNHPLGPYAAEQFLARKHPARVLEQQGKNLKLLARQFDKISVDRTCQREAVTFHTIMSVSGRRTS